MFDSPREICRWTHDKFNRLVTLRDINSFRRKFRLLDGCKNRSPFGGFIKRTRYVATVETQWHSAMHLSYPRLSVTQWTDTVRLV